MSNDPRLFSRLRSAMRGGCLLLVCSFIVASAYAQSSASLNGVIRDVSGGVVPDADIVLTNVKTGVAQTTRTNAAGIYHFIQIPPGHFTLSVSKQGFATVLQPDFPLDVNQTATVNFSLEVGAVTSKVTVASQAIQLETSTAELGAVVGTQEVLDLPLNGRNFTELLLLTPGASPANPLQNSGGAPGAIGTDVFPAMNGQSNRSNMFLLDGVNNYGAGSDTNAVQPTIDDVLEFKVQSHNDEAEYGQVLGGIVNLATKAGTNTYHGDGWDFFRNDALDASNFFSTVEKTPLHQNQFGGTLGGPVRLPHYDGRDRTFFYGSYEGFRHSTASPALYLVPTAAELNGDFSALSAQLYNPYSAGPDPNHAGSYINSPFMCDGSGNPLPVNSSGIQAAGAPCNKIPTSLFNPTMLAAAKALFPAPINTGNPNFNGQDNSPVTANVNQMSLRFDEQLGQRDRFFARYTSSWQSDLSSGGVAGDRSLTTVNVYNVGASWVHTFGNSWITQVTFGRVKGIDTSTNTVSSTATAFLQSANFAPNFVDHQLGGALVPTIDIGGYSTFSDFVSGGSFSNIYELKTDESKMLGHHLLKFGFSVATDNQDNVDYGSVDQFGAIQTSSGSAAAGGDSLASTLLGLPTYAELDNVDAYLHGGKIFGGYFEDQWKVNDRLTLNLGLRYDVTDWPVEGKASNHSNITGNMNLNNGTYVLENPAPACSATQGAPCIPGGVLPANVTVSPNGRIMQNTYDNIQPRVGLALRITNKTVFRAAYGRLYDNWAAVENFGANFTESWPNVSYLSASNLNSPLVTVTANDPLGIGSGPIPEPVSPFTQSDGFLDPELRNPYSDQFNMGFQREWGAHSVLTVNYVGSRNHREEVQLTGNAATTPGPGNPELRAPFPYILAQKGYVQSIGKSSYNALQVSSEGRSSSGLTHIVSYTYSKDLSLGCNTYQSSCDIQNPYHPENDRGVAGWDLTHIFAGSLIYPLPFGKGRRWGTGSKFTDYVVGGWQLGGIATASSGTPYDIRASTNIANMNNISGAERANMIGNPYANTSRIYPINKAAFAAPAAYTFGDMGVNILRSDWRRNLDFSVSRSFPFGESKRVEFRAEAFNLTNTPEFSKPQTTITNRTFGIVSSTANTQREIQLALKIYF